MHFPTTNWHQIAEATMSGDLAGRAALEALCADYRAPVRALLIARGYAPHEADDFTQDFFAELVRNRAWKRASRDRGRFRSFVCAILRHVIGHARERQEAGKRGGAALAMESIEDVEMEISDTADADVFDREWALHLLDRVLAAVAQDYTEREWDVLSAFLPGSRTAAVVAEAASKLGISEMNLRTRVHRLRLRFRDHLRTRVARTVGSIAEIDEEIAYLRRVLSAHGM